MKVILQKPVDKLGTPGQVVEVADGYARNYLVPRGLAVAASKGAVRHAESLTRAHEQRVSKARQAAEALAAALQEVTLKVAVRAGEDGKLFGSVTSAELADELERASEGLEIDRHDVRLDEPIRSLGVHPFKVHLGQDVDVELSVEVVPAE
jgi:large subunit ribosomal protein L9